MPATVRTVRRRGWSAALSLLLIEDAPVELSVTLSLPTCGWIGVQNWRDLFVRWSGPRAAQEDEPRELALAVPMRTIEDVL